MLSNQEKNFTKKNTSIKKYYTGPGYSNLRTYLGNVRKGRSKVLEAPFAKGQDMAKVMSDWKSTLESIADEWPTLIDFENDLAKKVGPRSVMQPLKDRIADIESYYRDIHLSAKPVSTEAIQSVIQEFSGVRGIRLRSQSETARRMKMSTNSGSPFHAKRRDVINKSMPVSEFWNDSDLYLMYPDHTGYIPVAELGWRGQEGGPKPADTKQRVVWMFPLSVNIRELQFYQPFKEAAQSLNLVPAWVSNEAVDKSITNLFDSKDRNDLIVCTDFSKFDQHFNSTLQDAARTIIAALLTNNTPSQRWIKDVFPIKYNIPLVYDYTTHEEDEPGLLILMGEHGMASGSGGTNDDETLAHRSLQYEAAIARGKSLNRHSMCLGDDGILSYPGITVEDVVEVYQSHGQVCNVDKQYASSQDCVFLRRWHHNDYRVNGECVGVYSSYRALGKLRYLERWMDPEIWTPEMVALRQLSIIENCKYHPLFEQFVEFCMKRDEFRLGLDIPGFMDNIASIVRKSADYMPDFLGYTKTLQGEDGSGISQWEVVKLLKSKA